MRVRATPRVCLAAVVLAVPILSSGFAQSPNTSTAAVVEAAAGYIAKYEQQLTSVLAMEVSTQRIVRRVRPDAGPRSRALKSEIFFMFSPAEHEWMAVRDVHEVDGKPVEDPPDLKNAMATLPLIQIARTLKSYSSRYNIGMIERNFGEPTLSLLVLDANHRANFGFERTGVERKAGAVLVTLYFHERGSQTLLHYLSGAPVPSEGELVVEADTGRIRRAVLRAQLGTVRAELTTTYQPDAGLEMWVPSAFSEQYDDDVGTTYHQVLESILCEAKYSDFRRFDALGRIKK